MTTIAAGASGSYTFTDNTTALAITLDPNERALVEVRRSGAVVFSDRISGSRTIGPFLLGDVATLTADGAAIDYSATYVQSTLSLSSPQVAGVAKAPGLSPLTTAAAANANADLINAQLAAGGKVEIPQGLGDIYIGKTVIIPSYTEFKVGPGSRLKRIATAGSWQMARNKYGQNGCYVNGVTVAGGVFVMPEPGHSRVVGDQVYIEGFLTNATLNGLKTVAAVVEGVSWSFAATGVAPTNTGVQLAFVNPSNPLLGANVTRATNVATVLETGHTRGIGDRVYITGLTSANTLNGAYEITGSTPGVSWTYASTGADETATGTGQLLADRGITAVFDVDGNSINISASQWGAHTTCWVNVSKSTISFNDARYTRFGRLIAGHNCSDMSIPLVRGSKLNGVGVQFDSFCDRIDVGTVTGLSFDDDMVAWGVTNASGAFGDTASPTGPGNMGTLTVGNILGNSVTGILKCYAYTGYDLGRVKVGRIKGNGPVTIGDSTAGVGGGTITELTIDDLNNAAVLGTTSLLALTSGFSSIQQINIGRFVDTPLAAGDTGYGIYFACPVTNIHIKHRIMTTARTGRGMSIEAAVGTLTIDRDQSQSDSTGSTIMVAAGGVVTNFIAGNVVHTSPNANQGYYAFSQSGGYISNMFVTNFKGTKGGAIYGNNTASQTHNIHLTNVRVDQFSTGLNGSVAGTWNIFLSGVAGTNLGNNFIQLAATGLTARVVARGFSAPANKHVQFSGSTVLSLDGTDIRIDMGASAGAVPSQITAVAGDMIYNTNATGGGVYGRTAAGAWQAVF